MRRLLNIATLEGENMSRYIFGKTTKGFVSSSIRTRATKGLGWFSIARELHLLYPHAMIKDCKIVADQAYTSLIFDDPISLANLTSLVASLSDRHFSFGADLFTTTSKGGLHLSPYLVAKGLMDMARGYSKEWR